jgi:hypothetical protein
MSGGRDAGTDTCGELKMLADQYARAVDGRDAHLLLDVFDPDARLRVFTPADSEQPRTDLLGHEAIERITRSIARYAKTYHFVGNASYDIAGDEATGEVYCIAHHLTQDEATPNDYVMYIRYHDAYRRDAGRWRIVDRRVVVDWTESRPAIADSTR